MIVQVLKNESYEEVSNLPQKGSDRATGFDVVAVSDPEIVGELVEGTSDLYKRIDYIQYKTNLKVAVQKDKKYWPGVGTDISDYDVLAFPRSSVSKYNLQLANSIGLIDADYRGEVMLRFNYLWQPEDLRINTNNLFNGIVNLNKIYKKGEKICQLKVTKVEDVNFVLVNELDSTSRGEGGFGSTDLKKNESVKEAVAQMQTIEAMYNNIGGINTPSRKYSELVKEREAKQFNQ
jgi:dUTP pyrophosphatase